MNIIISCLCCGRFPTYDSGKFNRESQIGSGKHSPLSLQTFLSCLLSWLVLLCARSLLCSTAARLEFGGSGCSSGNLPGSSRSIKKRSPTLYETITPYRTHVKRWGFKIRHLSTSLSLSFPSLLRNPQSLRRNLNPEIPQVFRTSAAPVQE